MVAPDCIDAVDIGTWVHGQVASGFEPVAKAFNDNVAYRGDTGASCAIYCAGELVVDLWVARPPDTAWSPDARSCVFSVSKGVTAVCLLMAAESGSLDLDAPVARYWPEFAANGKDETTVRQVLSHRAGLAWPADDLTIEQLQAWTPVTESLARQRPAWEPGTAFAYHALTVGWLAGEVLRRATGQRPGEWLEQRVAQPLSLQMRFGATPGEQGFVPQREPLPVTDPAAALQMQELLADPRAVRALSLGGAVDPLDLFGSFNQAGLLACELPAGNLVTNARSLARFYAATVGAVDGIRLLRPETVQDARAVQSEGRPFVGVDEGHRWGTGFMLSSRRRGMAGEGSFGHDGAGGQLAFAHLEHELAFAYHTSRPGGIPDDRAEALCAALRTCLI
jgi:CubicO group peptidase (beta-lactamase class C family)